MLDYSDPIKFNIGPNRDVNIGYIRDNRLDTSGFPKSGFAPLDGQRFHQVIPMSGGMLNIPGVGQIGPGGMLHPF